MKNTKSVVLGVVVLLALYFAGRFVYFNVIVAWPYREELKECLSEARSLDNKQETEAAENRCFNTYPHFN